MGSMTPINYAGSFPGEADGIIATGFLHDMNWPFVFDSLPPAPRHSLAERPEASCSAYPKEQS